MFQSEELKHKQKRSSKSKQNEASTTKLAPTVSQLGKKQGTTSRRMIHFSHIPKQDQITDMKEGKCTTEHKVAQNSQLSTNFNTVHEGVYGKHRQVTSTLP